MAKSKQQKQTILKQLEEKLNNSKSFIISAFDKLPVNQDQELRQELRQNDAQHEVTKKSLLEKTFTNNKVEGLPSDELIGNISITTSQDEVIGAKVLSKFAKGKSDFKIIGGLLDKVWFDASKIAELAKLPSKPELIAKTVGTIKAPLTGFVNVLSGNLRNLVNVLNNIKDNK